MKPLLLCLITLLLISCQHSTHKKSAVVEANTSKPAITPGSVIAASLAHEWRTIDAENTLYISLDTGTVIVELVPELAPAHVKNTKQLVRQGVFDGSQFYRVLDAFVAQGGPMYADVASRPQLTSGSFELPAEFTYLGDLGDAYTSFDDHDGFADQTGFIKSYAVGKDLDSGESWLLHCYGAFAMGRANDVNTGGTELYVINGPAQRYLDRNTTVFGRVVVGMEHIQALHRSHNIDGPVDLSGKNQIKRIQVAADMPTAQVMNIELLDSNSNSFGQLLQARKNRTGEWFVHQHDYMDACGIPIPIRYSKVNDSAQEN